MQNHSEIQLGATGSSRENEQAEAGWHIPKPATIPAPTYWPFVLSLGATLMGFGILTSTVFSVTGTVLFIIAIVKWIGELANDNR